MIVLALSILAVSSISFYSWIVLGVGFFTALGSILTWWLNHRVSDESKRNLRAKQDAELVRAEHEGWASLLVNLREQYEVVNNAYEQVLEELAATRRELEITRGELEITRERVRILERRQKQTLTLDDPHPARVSDASS